MLELQAVLQALCTANLASFLCVGIGAVLSRCLCSGCNVHVVTNGRCKRFGVDNVGTVAAGLSAWLAMETLKVSAYALCRLQWCHRTNVM
jgi:hypothetical protein